MYSLDVNFIAIIVTAVLYLIIGGVWYSPNVFGKTWMELSDVKVEEMKNPALAYAGGFIQALITSFVLALFLHNLNISNFFSGAAVGFWAWLGFSAPTQFSAVLWENKNIKVFLINTGCTLLFTLLAGAILAVW